MGSIAMGKKRNLLIINYVMDPAHPALAHQVDVVESLAPNFDNVTVLTGYVNYRSRATNIRIISTNWQENKNIRNVASFYKKFFQLLISMRFNVVFSHMTLIQSFLIAPILRMFRIKHFLWYAHAQNSFYLKVVSEFCSGLISSTNGSCPIKNSKVRFIGQAIDPNVFTKRPSLNQFPKNFVHIGRLDPAKNAPLIRNAILASRAKYENFAVTFIGNPSNASNKKILEKLKIEWRRDIEDGWLQFQDAIPRREIPQALNKYDVFIHAFKGSLDKSLIEATFNGMPVITLNNEYIHDFGSWSSEESLTLEHEINSLMKVTPSEMEIELKRRREIALLNHSFEAWINKLLNILNC